jgi:hypothetical protein
MALINCPECNKEISDKVKACPHCGYPFESSVDKNQDLQKVEISAVNIKPTSPEKKKRLILGLIIAVVVLAVGIAAIFVGKTIIYNNYIENLNTARMSMLNGGSDAENLLNLTAKVWNNSIMEESDPETNKYTRSNDGWFYDDFNIALGLLIEDKTTIAKIAAIEENQQLVEGLMKELQNPPANLETCYATLNELYTIYRGLTNLAINPSGSYNSFVADKQEKITSFIGLYDKLETQIPEK